MISGDAADLRRRFDATPEAVFAAFSDSGLISRLAALLKAEERAP